MSTSDESYEAPEFDQDLANAMLGKRILVGVTVEDRRGEFKRQEQFHGVVVSTSQKDGILLQLQGVGTGETKWLPPATNFYQRAEPGIYKIRSTGESVADPDFTCTWLVIEPDA